MRIVFFGTAPFAVPSLEQLIAAHHTVVACVTQPDREKGRALAVTPTAVKVAAGKYGIPVFQPYTLLSDTAAQLKKTMPDLFVVIAYGQLLKADILAIPRYYAVN
ncbi:MAG: formyltransferase family protein, partial [Candidatus Omnitrophica bacterium]|nr:formyltransferase family protein [Candidatus Omnitrophota bacterium]